MFNLRQIVVRAAAVLVAVAGTSGPALGWGQEGFGPAPSWGRSTSSPEGIDHLMGHGACVYWFFVNGNMHFYYDGGVDVMNQLIDAFSKTDLTRHDLIIRPGRPTARSFRKKQIPYTVLLEQPPAINSEYSTTGLYPLQARLTVYVDAPLADHLDELKIPSNVTVRRSAHRVADALQYLDAGSVDVRRRAISVLADSGDTSDAVITALKDAGKDTRVGSDAQKALEALQQGDDPKTAALRDRINTFVHNHPQALAPPRGRDVLETLRRIDSEYAKGFTATGTMTEPHPSGRDLLFSWLFTMGDGRTLLRKRVVDSEGQPPQPGAYESTILIGPQYMTSISNMRRLRDGELKETGPLVHGFEKPGITYDLFVGQVKFSLGRGFGIRLKQITEVRTTSDGQLIVIAHSAKSYEGRMQLRIDPQADYLVRSARHFRGERLDVEPESSTVGMVRTTGRSVAHTAIHRSSPWAHPVSIAITSVSAEADLELIRKTETWVDQAKENGAQMIGKP